MALPEVNINLVPGAGRKQESKDGYTGLIIVGTAPMGWATNQIFKITGLKNAALAGITDSVNTVKMYKRLKRFFSYAPNAVVFLMYATTGDISDAVTIDGPIIKTMRAESNGEIRQFGVLIEGTHADLTDVVISDGITNAQATAKDLFDLHQPAIFVIGIGSVTALGEVPDLRVNASELVTVCAAYDSELEEVALCDVLGCIAAAKVSENIGWVDKFPLTDIATNRFVTAGFTSAFTMGDLSDAEIESYHEKGWLFARQIPGKAGYYFNTFPTCTALNGDYSYGENTRTVQKAARVVYQSLVGNLNSPVPLKKDGTIQTVYIGDMQSKVERGLQQMLSDKEISNFEVYINPDQVLFDQQEQIEIETKVQPYGTARMINVSLSLTAKI